MVEEDIVGQDIDSEPVKHVGKAIPSHPKRPKVELLSDDEDDEDEPPLASAQPAEERHEVDPEAQVRKNAVHVYGLDFLKTHHMEEIFVQFGHKYVEWINASSANIIFKNAEGAKKALEALSFPKTEDEPWRRTPDILVSEGVPPIFLQMRLATVNDVKKSKKSVPKAMSPMHYAQVFYKNQQQAMRQGRTGRPPRSNPKAKPKAGTKRLLVTEEEQQKRQKRSDRFGEKSSDAPNEAAEAPADAASAADASAGADTATSTPKVAVSRAPPKVIGVPAPKIRPAEAPKAPAEAPKAPAEAPKAPAEAPEAAEAGDKLTAEAAEAPAEAAEAPEPQSDGSKVGSSGEAAEQPEAK